MTDLSDDDEVIEVSEEDLAEMVEEARDILALALPEDADDAWWRELREDVERRAQAMADGGEDEDEDEEA
jgi:hypothetical protein